VRLGSKGEERDRAKESIERDSGLALKEEDTE
jgi:hypothetical protein